MSQTREITIILHVGDYIDESSIVAIFGNREREVPNTLSDIEWFEKEEKTKGLIDLLDLDNPDAPLSSGLWLIQGKQWAEYISTTDGAYYDGGFDAKRFEPLPLDPTQAIYIICEAIGLEDRYVAIIENLINNLNSSIGRNKLHSLIEVLNVLREIK